MSDSENNEIVEKILEADPENFDTEDERIYKVVEAESEEELDEIIENLEEDEEVLEAEEIQEEFEKYFFGFLDNEEDPVKVHDFDYLEVWAPRIEEELDLAHPRSLTFLQYPSGSQMIYDSVTQLLENNGVYETILENPINLSYREKVSNIFKYLRKRVALQYMSERVMGTTDVNQISVNGIPGALEDGNEGISFVPENIDRFSEKCELDPYLADKYVKTHEGIHTIQTTNFPMLEERRSEAIERLISSDTDSEKEEIKEEMQSMMAAMEGHAEFFTNRTFEKHVDFSYDRSYGFRDKLVLKALGLYDKAIQYQEGSDFIETLYEEGGTALANEALANPPLEQKEVRNPEIWMERVNYQKEISDW